MGFTVGAGVDAARAGRSGVPSPHSVSPEKDRAMLRAEDLGGLRCRPAVGGAGVANGVLVVDDDGGGIADTEGLAIFEWNLAWGRRIDPGTGILLVIVELPIRGIRD